jgi:thymidine kinase
LANYSFRKTDNDKLVMLGETEEYEPLSRAAYFYAMQKSEENHKLASEKTNKNQE